MWTGGQSQPHIFTFTMHKECKDSEKWLEEAPAFSRV